MNKTQKFLSILGMSLLLSLAGCGGGGGGGSSAGDSGGTGGGDPGTGNGGDIATTAIAVTPALGAFSAGAVVRAYASDGTLLATASTDTNGRVPALAIPASHTGVVILRVSGGQGVTYFDEGSNSARAFGADQSIYSVIPASAVSASAAFGVTPLTNLLAGLVGVDTTASAPSLPSGQATDAAVNTAKQQVTLMTGLPIDVLAAPDPLKDLSTPKDGSSTAGLYGVLLAEMARQASLQGRTALDQALDLKGNATNAGALTPLITSVRQATDQLQSHALLDVSRGTGELNKVLAASAVAKAPSDVIGQTADVLSQLKATQENERTAKAQALATSPDIQGIWNTTGDSLPGTAVITADRQLVLRLSPDDGSTRLVVAKFMLNDSGGYTASGKELLMQNGETTASEVTLTASRTSGTSPMTLVVRKNGQAEPALSLSAQDRYEAPENQANLAYFAGTWTDQIGTDYLVRWVIDAAGNISGQTTSACIWSGRVSMRGEAKAVADVAVTESCYGTVKRLRGIAVFKADSDKRGVRLSLFNETASSALLLDMNKQ